mmetsp:Transcript_18070/g.47116  ORF Transcript_18070/g.47116 Transcript_18070/m.47116 type:complete len:225 (-) Transcript_18070:45-719(-)
MGVRCHCLWGCLDRTVHRLHRLVDEKWLRSVVGTQNLKRTIGIKGGRVVAIVGKQRLRAARATIGPNIEVKVDATVLVREVIFRAAVVAHETIVPSVRWSVLPVEQPEMPLPNGVRGVAKFLHVLRKDLLCQVEAVPLAILNDPSLQPESDWVPCSVQCTACRGAAVHHIVVSQDDTTLSKAVNVWRFDARARVPKVAKSKVVRYNHPYVWLRGACRHYRRHCR